MTTRIDDLNQSELSRRNVLALAGAAATAVSSTMSRAASAAISPSEIVMMDAVGLASAIRSRQVSCVECMTAYLDHIERLNPKVNAIVALQDRACFADPVGRARRATRARRADGAVARSSPCRKGFGARQGHPDRHMGSPILKDFVPTADSIMVERLRNAGAIFIGKTNTPEFGLGSHTYNPVYGVTRNAYDQSRSAGGSSGGAAVSLALRMLPVADGSDYGGSLRNPAGWNNVFGFRTSYRPRANRCARCLAAVDGRRRADGAQCCRSRHAAPVQAGYDARDRCR